MPIEYANRGGASVSVVHCPRILPGRLVHLSQSGQSSWVLRDYLTGQMLRCAPPPNASYSKHTLADIEGEIAHSEWPPEHNLDHRKDWETYLRLRTMAVLRSTPATTPPNPAFGDWRPM